MDERLITKILHVEQTDAYGDNNNIFKSANLLKIDKYDDY